MPWIPYNQLLDEHSLSDTGTSEETDLTTTSVGGEEVDNLDTGNQDLSGGGLLGELRGVGVDGGVLGGLDGFQVPVVYAQVDAAQAALRAAMATDVPWHRYLGDLAATYPAGVWLTSLNASVDPAVPSAGSGSVLVLMLPLP